MKSRASQCHRITEGAVAWHEAKHEGIRMVHLASRDDQSCAPHRWDQFLRCPSFRWFIVAPDDTLIMPADRLHGTWTIGSEVATSTGHYLASRASLPHLEASWAAAPQHRMTRADEKAVRAALQAQTEA